MKIKVGILFGGSGRERDLSWESARYVYDQLDQTLFEAVPLFVDIRQRIFSLPPAHLFLDSIPELFAQTGLLPDDGYRVNQESLAGLTDLEREVLFRKIGDRVDVEALPGMINLAFLAFGFLPEEDRIWLRRLEELRIPFTGYRLPTRDKLRSATGYYEQLAAQGFPVPDHHPGTGAEDADAFLSLLRSADTPMVIRPDGQGRPYADSRLDPEEEEQRFKEALNLAGFREEIPVKSWRQKGEYDQHDHLQLLTDLRFGLGFPVSVKWGEKERVFDHPAALEAFFRQEGEVAGQEWILQSDLPRGGVLLEARPEGAAFICTVVDDAEGRPLALHPELSASVELTQLEHQYIRRRCQEAYQLLNLGPCFVFSGIWLGDGELLFTADRLSLFWDEEASQLRHGAQLGWPITDFINHFLISSLRRRVLENPGESSYRALLDHLQALTRAGEDQQDQLPRVALLVRGQAAARRKEDRESARFLFEELNTLGKYQVNLYHWTEEGGIQPLPISKVYAGEALAVGESPLRSELQAAIRRILRQEGHPGFELGGQDLSDFSTDICFLIGSRNPEDLNLLRGLGLSVYGPQKETLRLANKNYQVVSAWEKNGFSTVPQLVLERELFEGRMMDLVEKAEARFPYPVEARPPELIGRTFQCRIRDREDLLAYAKLAFRPPDTQALEARRRLRISADLAFPRCAEFVVAPLMDSPVVKTYPLQTGVLYHGNAGGTPRYEVLDSSMWQDDDWITPAVFGRKPDAEARIQRGIRQEIERALRIVNLDADGVVESFLRIYPDDSFKVIFANIDPWPALIPNNCIFAQALERGYDHPGLLDQMIKTLLHPAEPVAYQTSELNMMNESADMNPESSGPERPEEHTTVEVPPVPWWKKAWSETKDLLSASIFWRNVAAVAVLSFLLLFLVNWALGLYTYHGQSYVVEDYRGMSFEEARRKARSNTFRAVITDSIFVIGEPPNIVKDQDPQPGSKVKRRRTIYLWVTGGKAPDIVLPSLDGIDDYESYRRELERRGVDLVIRERRFDRQLQENTILELYYQGEKIPVDQIKQGFKVTKGSTVSCVVTKRVSENVLIPDLVCKTFSEAKFMLESSRLMLGEVYGTRANDSYVWKQVPAFTPDSLVRQGTTVSLHLTTEKPEGCP